MIVLEDDYVCCILDHNPYNEGHVLILPKNHIQYFDELDEDTANSLIKAAKLLSSTIKELFHPEGITICQNGGAFDELTHFHMHVIPRYKGQSFADFYMEEETYQIEDKSILEATKDKMVNHLTKIKLQDFYSK